MKPVYFIKEYGKFKEGDKVKLDNAVLQALLREGVVSFTYEPKIEKPKKGKK